MSPIVPVTGPIKAWLSVIILLCCLPAALDAGGGSQALNDDLFIRQLTGRRLYSLAEHHCRDMRQRETTADDKAMWQLRLAKVCEEHAWQTDSVSRREVLNQSIEELIRFPRDNAVSAEFELRLRFQQARIVRTSVRIALVLIDAGRLFGSGRDALSSTLTDPRMAAPGYAKNIGEAIQLIEKSLQQLENIRSNIPAPVARDLRESSRLLLAELHLLRSRPAISTDAQAAAKDVSVATELLTLILRSVQDPEIKYAAQWLQSELLLTSDSKMEFESQIRVLTAARRRENDTPPEFLSVRHLLSAQEAEQSLRLLTDTSAETALHRQQKEWLSVECLLGLRQLAERLQDVDLIAEATDRFQIASQRSQASTDGVFREAVSRVIRRFDLVDSVGVAVADLIEEVDTKRAKGKSQEALQLIDITLQRLPRTGTQLSRAALNLHAGELLIEMKQWKAGHERLTISAEQFESSKRRSEQATADLLAIFCFAQMLSGGDTYASKAAYTESLQRHIVEFADESTLTTAQKWLLQIIQDDKPLEAVELLFSMLTRTENRVQKLDLLEQLGRLLTGSASTLASKSHIDAFRKSARQLMESGELPDTMLAVVNCCILQLDIEPGQPADWKSLQQRIATVKSALETRSPDDASVSTALQHCRLLEAVVSARLRQDSTNLKRQRDALLALSNEQAVAAVDYFFSHYGGQELQTGDQWLAQVSDSLLRSLVKGNVSLDTQIHWLKASARNAVLTGSSVVQNLIIEQISRRKLSPVELKKVANAMSSQQDGVSTTGPAATTAGAAVRTNFWRQVLSSSEQGTNTWLEASLRLAEFSAAAGETDASKRQLGVIMALYPQWGSPDRLKRAQALMSTLTP